MRRFLLERDIPGIGRAGGEELKAVARTFNKIVGKLGSDVQWVESYVAADKTFCVFFAPSEALIREYCERAGFPIDTVTEITAILDSATVPTE